MKRKDIKGLHGKGVVELTKEMEAKKSELTKLVVERRIKPAKNTRLTQTLRDDMARIATVLKELSMKEKKQI